MNFQDFYLKNFGIIQFIRHLLNNRQLQQNDKLIKRFWLCLSF